MDILKLQRMITIYEAGSFRKAAKDLGMSQPALTSSIQQLEEALRGRLFERGARGIRPTALCERMVRRARLIVREQQRLLREADENARNLTLSIGVHSLMLTPALGRCVAAFCQQWPTTTLRVREGYSRDLIERLLSGELDFACCAIPAEGTDIEALTIEPLAVLHYSVVARADHPVFADIDTARPIGAYDWVDFDAEIVGVFPGESDIDAILDAAGRAQGRRGVRSASMDLIKLLVLEGGFIGLIGDESVAAELASGVLRRLPGVVVAASRFGFIGLKDDFETDAARALKQLLREFALASLALR